MEQAFSEQSNISERPKSEVELTLEEEDEFLRHAREYLAGLKVRLAEVKKIVDSFGGEAALMEEYEELKHTVPWWREFNEDIENRNFESITVKSI